MTEMMTEEAREEEDLLALALGQDLALPAGSFCCTL